jgi:hypothetical protein
MSRLPNPRLSHRKYDMTVKVELSKNKPNISNPSPNTLRARARARVIVCIYVYMHVCTYVCTRYVSSERPSTTSKEVCTALMSSVHYVQHNPKNCMGLSSKINNQ